MGFEEAAGCFDVVVVDVDVAACGSEVVAFRLPLRLPDAPLAPAEGFAPENSRRRAVRMSLQKPVWPSLAPFSMGPT